MRRLNSNYFRMRSVKKYKYITNFRSLVYELHTSLDSLQLGCESEVSELFSEFSVGLGRFAAS